MHPCDDMRDDLLGYVYDELDPERRAAVEEHLRACEGCRQERELLANVTRLLADGATVADYVAPGSDHTILGSDAFYTLEVAGVPFVEWVRGLVEGEMPPDVRCSDCR